MKLSLSDVRAEADRFAESGEHAIALRLYLAVLRRAPDDYEARLSIADALAGLGAGAEAAPVYQAVADLCIDGGRPLIAAVASRAVERVGGEGDAIRLRLAADYGRGSKALAEVGGRISIHHEGLSVDARELRSDLTVQQLVAEAAALAASLDAVGELPLKVPADPLLSALSPVALTALLRAATVRRVPAGHVVLQEGEEAASFFLVARGRVRVIGKDDFLGQRELATLGEGAIVGEMALLAGTPRSATVQAITAVDLLEIGKQALASLGDELAAVEPALTKVAHARWMSNLLHQSTLFRVFSAEQKRELLSRFAAQDVPKGTVLFRQGETARGIYLVFKGEVALSRDAGSDPEGARVSSALTSLHAGAMVGVKSALSGEVAAVTAVTTAPSTLLFLSRRLIEQLSAAVPEFVEAVSEVAQYRSRLLAQTPAK